MTERFWTENLVAIKMLDEFLLPPSDSSSFFYQNGNLDKLAANFDHASV